MSTIRIRQRIESETLHLPELRPLIGRTVEIVIDDSPAAPRVRASAADWDAVLAASQQLEDYDYQAQVDQDACDIRDAEAITNLDGGENAALYRLSQHREDGPTASRR